MPTRHDSTRHEREPEHTSDSGGEQCTSEHRQHCGARAAVWGACASTATHWRIDVERSASFLGRFRVGLCATLAGAAGARQLARTLTESSRLVRANLNTTQSVTFLFDVRVTSTRGELFYISVRVCKYIKTIITL